MDRVIAGRFQTEQNADAVAALITRYIHTAEVRIFNNDSPGQRRAFVAGGNVYDLAPPVGATAERGVYEDRRHAQDRRSAGVTLSVRITNPVNEDRVIAALRAAGAEDIKPDYGEWRDEVAANFNSSAAMQGVQRSSHG